MVVVAVYWEFTRFQFMEMLYCFVIVLLFFLAITVETANVDLIIRLEINGV